MLGNVRTLSAMAQEMWVQFLTSLCLTYPSTAIFMSAHHHIQRHIAIHLLSFMCVICVIQRIGSLCGGKHVFKTTRVM